MGLFTTLASSASEVSSTSSLTVPTMVQLFTTKALTIDPNAKNAGKHAVLSYQAIDVGSVSTESSQEELFGHKRKAADKDKQALLRPDFGVWNCRCQPVLLADHLLRIPKTPYFCFTVDLTDPSRVEPTISVLHEALVRVLISTCGARDGGNNCTTTLYDLKSNQFGLAAEDKEPTTTIAPEEDDRKVHFGLLICALRSSVTKQEDYQQTQAHNLVWYHLRRYAAALNATLCLVQIEMQNDEEETDQPALTVPKAIRVFREFCLGHNEYIAEYDKEDGSTPIYGPGSHHEDLIESVLMRNAQCPGHWDANKNSLWAALPAPVDSAENVSENKAKSSGDEGWLSQLQQSVGVATEKSGQKQTPVAATPSPGPNKDNADAASFFESLMKK